MRRIFRDELGTAVQTDAWCDVEPILTTTVGIERGVAVPADDLQVREPIVGRDPVDVVEDQGHSAPCPHFALTTQL